MTPLLRLPLTLLAACSTAFAVAPLASDPFSTDAGRYTPGAANLIGQGPATTGFVGNWLPAYGGAGSPDVRVAGLEFAGAAASGGSVAYPGSGSGRCGRLLGQSYGAAAETTIYIGVLLQLEFVGSGYRAFEMHRGGFDDGGNRVFQIATGEPGGGVVGGNELAVRINNSDSYVASFGMQDTEVNFFVVRIDLAPAPGGDSVTVFRNPADLAVEGNNTGVALSGFDLAFDRLSLARFGSDGLAFDELRVGTTFNDVTETANPDSDGDGMDDGWELLHGLEIGIDDSAGDAEYDNDGLTNLEEFLAGTDPNEADSDGDGIDDAPELDGTGNAFNGAPTDPTLADSDGDRLGDGEEVGTANGHVTNPNSADTDGDGEGDAIEIAEGNDPTDAASNAAARGRIALDGRRDALYGGAVAVQTVQTGFGDNLNELDAAYAAVTGGRLNLLLTGNIESNFNKLHLFIDSRAGGAQTLTSAGNDNAARMDGLNFDAGFAPDFHLILRRGTDAGGPKFDLDFADLGSGEYAFFERVFGAALDGRGETGVPTQSTFGTAPAPQVVAYDNSNAAGVGGSEGAPADPAAARAVGTGVELAIDLATLGMPSGELRACAFVSSGDHAFLSNQFLAGLPAGSANLGDPALVDLSIYAGEQFFAVPVPQVLPEVVDVIARVDIEELEVVWSSVPGASYIIETSSDLEGWLELTDNHPAGAGATTSITLAAGYGSGSRLFVRITPN